MKPAAAAFYGAASGSSSVGSRESSTGFEENRCSMTYMFEYPEYRRVASPRRVARLYPAYGLYSYGEGLYAQETRASKLTGAPVLFLPGNAGSYKQARSSGSVASRKAENSEGGLHLNVFTVDFNEESVALYGGSSTRQTHFSHESIKAISRSYKHSKTPPQGVASVGHSMGGVVARALFTLPRFNPQSVGLIITQASPHVAPVSASDPYSSDFYAASRQKWVTQADKSRNVTVLSVGGGYRDYQVRSGSTSLPAPPGDPNKSSSVVTAVPRTWVSTDHSSIVWCKESVSATVRAFFDLIDAETRQFTGDSERRSAVSRHHFIRNPVRTARDAAETPASVSDVPEAWSEVNTLRSSYRTPKEGTSKYFSFASASRRKAFSHFYCRSNNSEASSWVFGCVHTNGSSCSRTVDSSAGTESSPAYKVSISSLSDSSSFTHSVVTASNSNGKQFTVECEWQREESQNRSVSVPHVSSFGFPAGDVTINSSGLLHNVQSLHFHEVYQAFRISVASQCRGTRDRLPSVYRIRVPWFREDSFTTASTPSLAEISAMLHTSRPDNASTVSSQLHTAPNCQYKVSIRTSFPKVSGQVSRFCAPSVPVYMAVTSLSACRGQSCSVSMSGGAADMSQTVAGGSQPLYVNLPVYSSHILLSSGHLQEIRSASGLPPEDSLPPTFPDAAFREWAESGEEWPRLSSPSSYSSGAAVAFWGCASSRSTVRLASLSSAPLHRPSVSRTCGTSRFRTRLLSGSCSTAVGWNSCGAAAIFASSSLHSYRVVRSQMTERSSSHMSNSAPRKQEAAANGAPEAPPPSGAPSSSEAASQEVRDDSRSHLSSAALLMSPVMLAAPSLLHWMRNSRFSTRSDPDPCWLHSVPSIFAYSQLIDCDASKLSNSRLSPVVSRLSLPLAVVMATFSSFHSYRVAYFSSAALVPSALCCAL